MPYISFLASRILFVFKQLSMWPRLSVDHADPLYLSFYTLNVAVDRLTLKYK